MLMILPPGKRLASTSLHRYLQGGTLNNHPLVFNSYGDPNPLRARIQGAPEVGAAW